MTTRAVLTDGYRTNLREEGEGTPFLLLHGWSDNHRTFDVVLPELARRGRAIAMDFKGHGWSDKPDAPYRLGELVSQVEAVLLSEDLRGAVLIGNSMGGLVALHAAMRRPERVKGLLLLNNAGFRFRIRGPGHLATIPVLSHLFLALSSPALVPQGLRATVRDPKLVTPERCAPYVEVLGMPGYRRTVQRIGTWICKDNVEEADLRALRVPTTLVWGAHDRVVPPSVGERMSRLIPNARWRLLPDIAHLPQVERPEVVIEEAFRLLDA